MKIEHLELNLALENGRKRKFPHQESNPGLLGESQLSYSLDHVGQAEHDAHSEKSNFSPMVPRISQKECTLESRLFSISRES